MCWLLVFYQRFRTMGDKIANKRKKAKTDARPAKKPIAVAADIKPLFAAKGGKSAK